MLWKLFNLTNHKSETSLQKIESSKNTNQSSLLSFQLKITQENRIKSSQISNNRSKFILNSILTPIICSKFEAFNWHSFESLSRKTGIYSRIAKRANHSKAKNLLRSVMAQYKFLYQRELRTNVSHYFGRYIFSKKNLLTFSTPINYLPNKTNE